MKKLLLLPALFVFTSCISLPSLTPENQALVKDVALYICAADKAGLLKEGGELTTEQLSAIVAQFQNANMNGAMPTIAPAELEQRMTQLSEDPIQLGLFAQALIGEQMKCSTNSNAQ